MKKTVSGLLALILLLGACAGCGGNRPQERPDADPSGNVYAELLGVDPGETALETDGNTIPMELYLYWLTYSCSYLEYQLNMFYSSYGMYGELLNEDGSVKWDGELDGSPLGQMAKEQAENNALSYAVIENAAAHGAALTDGDRETMETELAGYIEELGGEDAFEQSLREMGVSRESFDRISAVGYLYQHLLEMAQDPAGGLYQAPSEDDAYVDHILLTTIDPETREPLAEEEIAEKRERADGLLAQLRAADPAGLEELFTRLADENGEDPGRAEETGYLINPDTGFVQEFKDAAFALKPGEISGVVESDYGYHILLRKELTGDQLAVLAGERLGAYLDGLMERARDGVVRSEKLEGIDVGSFFSGYTQAVKAMRPEEEGGGEPSDG